MRSTVDATIQLRAFAQWVQLSIAEKKGCKFPGLCLTGTWRWHLPPLCLCDKAQLELLWNSGTASHGNCEGMYWCKSIWLDSIRILTCVGVHCSQVTYLRIRAGLDHSHAPGLLLLFFFLLFDFGCLEREGSGLLSHCCILYGQLDFCWGDAQIPHKWSLFTWKRSHCGRLGIRI